MKLLVIGGGGREHALAWRLAKSPRIQRVFVAPGNGGSHKSDHIENVDLNSTDELIAFAKQQNIAYAVVGPEAPLAQGIVDAFRDAGLKIFGPTKAAAQLERSEEHTSDLQSLMRISYAVFCLKKKKKLCIYKT